MLCPIFFFKVFIQPRILCYKSTPLHYPLIKSNIPSPLHLYIAFFAQGLKIDSINRWKAYEIIFLTIYGTPLYQFFQDRVKILQDYNVLTQKWVTLILNTRNWQNKNTFSNRSWKNWRNWRFYWVRTLWMPPK